MPVRFRPSPLAPTRRPAGRSSIADRTEAGRGFLIGPSTMLAMIGKAIARLVRLAAPIGPMERSAFWPAKRRAHLRREPTCQACGTREDRDVHHIMPFHFRPDLELTDSNLITLCTPCHFRFGHLCDWRSWNAEVVYDAMIFLAKVRGRPYHRIESIERFAP